MSPLNWSKLRIQFQRLYPTLLWKLSNPGWFLSKNRLAVSGSIWLIFTKGNTIGGRLLRFWLGFLLKLDRNNIRWTISWKPIWKLPGFVRTHHHMFLRILTFLFVILFFWEKNCYYFDKKNNSWLTLYNLFLILKWKSI